MADRLLDDVGPITWRDGLTLFAGANLGSGITRDVYECALDVTCIVKCERNGGNIRFQNVNEWRTWQAVKDCKGIAKWFAPCEAISYAGLWLVQKRTQPISLDEIKRRLPRVPAFFLDLKAENWGTFEGRIVCHDYGLLSTRAAALKAGAMRKADWS